MAIFNRLFKTNKAPERMLVLCSTQVNKEAVRRENIDGVEHIIVSSATLPDDIVMNDIMYPAEEVERSYQSLNLTLAPIEHPVINGEYVSAYDPRAIHEFHAGAFNTNVRREDGRVYIDKVINVQEAKKTDRGKRLLDRVAELETSESPRPIHTSVGVFISVEELGDIKTNSLGQEYKLIARDMVFDHDAILLDSVGAATPDSGVGMAVNAKGEKIKVKRSEIMGGSIINYDPLITSQALVTIDADDIEEMSFNEIRDALDSAIKQSPLDGDYVADVVNDKVIFWADEQLFSAPFVMDGRTAKIVGIPVPVDRDVAYIPKTNSDEGDHMKELILNALKEAGIDGSEMTEDQLLDAYKGLHANQEPEGDDKSASDETGIAEIVANALKPLTEELEGLKAAMNKDKDAELVKYAEIVANSGLYPEIDVDTAKLLSVEKLKKMAANTQSSFGVSPVINSTQKDDAFAPPSDMPN